MQSLDCISRMHRQLSISDGCWTLQVSMKIVQHVIRKPKASTYLGQQWVGNLTSYIAN
jgi:hypothetical protein